MRWRVICARKARVQNLYYELMWQTDDCLCMPHKLVVEVLENENDQSFGTSDPEDVAPDTIAK